MAILEKVKFTVTAAGAGGVTSTYFFMAPVGLYSGAVATATGVSKADNDELDEPEHPVYLLLRYNKATRLHATCVKGTKRYRVGLVVARTKIATAPDDLKDKIINIQGRQVDGAKIVKVGNKLDASFS